MDKMALIVHNGSSGPTHHMRVDDNCRAKINILNLFFQDKIPAHAGYVSNDRYAWLHGGDNGVGQRGPESVGLLPQLKNVRSFTPFQRRFE